MQCLCECVCMCLCMCVCVCLCMCAFMRVHACVCEMRQMTVSVQRQLLSNLWTCKRWGRWCLSPYWLIARLPKWRLCVLGYSKYAVYTPKKSNIAFPAQSFYDLQIPGSFLQGINRFTYPVICQAQILLNITQCLHAYIQYLCEM